MITHLTDILASSLYDDGKLGQKYVMRWYIIYDCIRLEEVSMAEHLFSRLALIYSWQNMTGFNTTLGGPNTATANDMTDVEWLGNWERGERGSMLQRIAEQEVRDEEEKKKYETYDRVKKTMLANSFLRDHLKDLRHAVVDKSKEVRHARREQEKMISEIEAATERRREAHEKTKAFRANRMRLYWH